MTPSTSGLEVVAWLTTGGDVTRSEAYAKEQSVNDPENYPVALVTAASAQARLDEIGMLVRMLVQHVPETKQIRAKALDYLSRHNLMGSPLRADAALQQETQP